MKEKEWKEKRDGYFDDFRIFNEEYFKEHPTHGIYDSYSIDADGNVKNLYIGIEDENGNAITGYDEYVRIGEVK